MVRLKLLDVNKAIFSEPGVPGRVSGELMSASESDLGHNFQTRSDRAFILHMCIPSDKTFNMVP